MLAWQISFEEARHRLSFGHKSSLTQDRSPIQIRKRGRFLHHWREKLQS